MPIIGEQRFPNTSAVFVEATRRGLTTADGQPLHITDRTGYALVAKVYKDADGAIDVNMVLEVPLRSIGTP